MAHAQTSKDLLDLQMHTGSPESLQMTHMDAQHSAHNLLDDSDNQSNDGGEVEGALLGSEFSQSYSIKRPTDDTWSYVRGILLEVSLEHRSVGRGILSCIKDSSNIVINYYRIDIYWRVVGASFCM